jgi:hypothetical protein
MPKPGGLESALERFPEHAAKIRLTALRHEDFRAICADYDLAKRALARFATEARQPPRPEETEYRALIVEIERELLAALDDVGRHDGPGGRT